MLTSVNADVGHCVQDENLVLIHCYTSANSDPNSFEVVERLPRFKGVTLSRKATQVTLGAALFQQSQPGLSGEHSPAWQQSYDFLTRIFAISIALRRSEFYLIANSINFALQAV